MTEGMMAFAKRYKVSLNDPDLKRMYDLDMSARRDEASMLYNARLNVLSSTIRGMLNNGIPVEVIYKCVDAPRAEVDAIISGIQAK